MPRHARSLLVQYLELCLNMHIELGGRWQGKSVEERLCLVCKRGIVEDEFHFLCVNAKPAIHCVKIYLSHLMNVILGLKICNLEKKLSRYILKHEI